MAEPKLYFGTSSSTIYKNVTNSNMIITNNDTDILIITPTENVGIKNNSPSYDLDVNGNINTNNPYKINGNDVMSENAISNGVTSSNIQQLGTLNELNVSGEARITNLVITNDAQFDNDVNIDGNLNVVGTFTTSNSVLVNVTQNFIELTLTNSNNILDSGFYSQYIESGVTKYKGLFNDSSENDKFKLFKNYEIIPSSTINISHNSFELGDLDLNNLKSDNIESNDIQTNDLTVTNNANIKTNLLIEQDLNVSGNFHNNNLYVSNNIGINTSQPSYLLDISGIVNAKDYKLDGLTIFSNGSISNSITSSNLKQLGTLNNLNVTGNAYFNGNNYLNKANITNDLTISGNIGIQTFPNANYRINSNGDINTNSNYRVQGNIALSNDALGDAIITSNLKELGILNNLKITNSGNLLIGLNNQTNSNNKIDVTNGDVNIQDNYKINNNIVVSENSLGLSITQSNLKTFGIIENLNISGTAIINDLTITDKLSYGTNFKKNPINISNSVGIYNTTDTPHLDLIFNKTEFNNGTSSQTVGAINFKTDIGGFISDNNPNNSMNEFASIEVETNNILNDNNLSTDFIFKNAQLNTTNPREIMRLSENGKLNTINSYQINNIDVITENSIGNGITSSNLQILGELTEINVNNLLSVSNSINITSDIYIKGDFYDENSKPYEFSNISLNTSGDLYNLTNNLSLGTTIPQEKLHIESGNIYLNTTISDNFTNGIIKYNKHGNHDAIYFGEEMNNGTKITIDESGSSINIQTGGSGFNNTSQDINDRSGKFKISNYNKSSAEYETQMFMNTTGNIGLSTTNPLVKLHISANDAIVIPIGNSAERIDVTGAIRFNTDTLSFEGYGSSWGSLGGINDVDQDTYITAEDSVGNDNDELKFFTAGQERLKIDSVGNIGIGTTAINGKLEIAGNFGSVSFAGDSYGELTSIGAGFGDAATHSFSIYANGRIAASEFSAISDKRVKKILNERDIDKDLEYLKNVKIYNFEYIDKHLYSSRTKIGYMAQELEEYNRNLVNYSTNFIPNIFNDFSVKTMDDMHIIELDKKYDISINDILKLRIIKNNGEIKIKELSIINKINNIIYLSYSKNLSEVTNVFIYGKLVNDFKTVNWEQLIAINTNIIKNLKNENTELKEKVSNNELQIQYLIERLNRLETPLRDEITTESNYNYYI